MSQWKSLFSIIKEPRTFQRSDGTDFQVFSHYIVLRSTGDKVFPKTRKYGYSTEIDAKRGAAHIYRSWVTELEKMFGKE